MSEPASRSPRPAGDARCGNSRGIGHGVVGRIGQGAIKGAADLQHRIVGDGGFLEIRPA